MAKKCFVRSYLVNHLGRAAIACNNNNNNNNKHDKVLHTCTTQYAKP